MSDTPINPGTAVVSIRGYTPLLVRSVSGQSVDDLTASLSNLFPNQTVRATDDGGKFSNEWYRFLSSALQAQQGRVTATPTADLLVAINFAQNGVAQLQQIAEEGREARAALKATVDALTAQVQALTTMSGSAPADIPAAPPTPPPYIFPDAGGGGD